MLQCRDMLTKSPPPRSAADLLHNRRFYDALWADCRLVEPDRFNTWPLVQSLVASKRRRLEVAPGLRPRLPLEDTEFVDISEPALAALRRRGAHVVQSEISALPFANHSFDLICALDIIEHVDDDQQALAELSRVVAPGGTLLLSLPLHPSRWTAFDEFVGHRRRYEPGTLDELLRQYAFSIERSSAYGMQPRSSRLLGYGLWWLTHHRERALWWYNRIFMPLAVLFQKKLVLAPGLVATDDVDEVILVCSAAS